jgi:tellurite resistance protein TerC
MMNQQALLWGGFILFVLVMLALDLGVFQRGKQVMSMKESLIWCGIWAGIAMLFNVGIFLFHPRGTAAGLEFFTGYVVEESLSIDNIFVFLLIFSYFKVPRAYQHKVLFWGVIGALVFRAIFILGGLAILDRFHWMIYLFGGFLVVTGINLMFKREEKEVAPEKSWTSRVFRRFFRVTDEYDRDRFFTRQNGKRWATPLLAVLIAIESTDIIFAVDSIPAIFAITNDSFIVFSSNILAMLGIRALYFAVAGFVQSFYFLRYGFASIMVILGAKMLLERFVQLPIELSLVLIVFILLLCVIISLLRPRKVDLKGVFARTARLGLLPFRRLLVIENLIDHADDAVREVMRPRSAATVLRIEASAEENLRIVRENSFSRYPVVNAEASMPLGVFYVRDLALGRAGLALTGASLRELARPGLELREDISISDAVALFRRHSRQMGIVVDKNGLWTGIITLEDLVEELIGEIRDESTRHPSEATFSVADALSPGRIILELEATSTREAIEKLVRAVPRQELPADAATIIHALTEHGENPNYLGHGVAVPHARLDGLEKSTVFFGRADQGVELGPTNQHAEIFFVALCPGNRPNLEAWLLASITTLIESDYVLNRLRKAESPEEVIETIRAGEQILPL